MGPLPKAPWPFIITQLIQSKSTWKIHPLPSEACTRCAGELCKPWKHQHCSVKETRKQSHDHVPTNCPWHIHIIIPPFCVDDTSPLSKQSFISFTTRLAILFFQNTLKNSVVNPSEPELFPFFILFAARDASTTVILFSKFSASSSASIGHSFISSSILQSSILQFSWKDSEKCFVSSVISSFCRNKAISFCNNSIHLLTKIFFLKATEIFSLSPPPFSDPTRSWSYQCTFHFLWRNQFFILNF